ncbi:DUF5305 domain-containing protein [Natrarchaeobius oligotrophus]|uniref:DUF5305 domain-containing protein n=1 Tax=Natrarchaeobius chitinivorans TaxID=1679083 RepID=A0A3N6M5U0_NATCH|nr:DUF5305 domain-containing protein [Natrarchaeobius chitinivorans]RQG97477.1 hypothetical protein EA472_19140 [Natrarchaeobius chitinivorans]
MIDNPRLDLLLARHGRTVVVALVVIGILALAATGWVVANPETETSPQYAQESVTSEVHTSATVVEDTGLWSAGDELSDSPVYLLNATPELVVAPETRVANETAGAPVDDVTVTHRLTLRFVADRDGETFWSETHEELDATASVEDGAATSSTTIDVRSYHDRLHRLEEAIAGVGSITLELHLDVEYDTGTHQGTQNVSTPLQLSDDAYWLVADEPLSDSTPHTHRIGTERTTHQQSPLVIGLLSLIGTLALAGAAFVAHRSPADVESARRAVHERRYAEWISRGSIPMWIGNHHIALDTLEDVVDVAIDTNERVVHDRQRGLFAVVNGDVVYYYSERGLWEQTTWPEMDLSDGQSVVDAEQVLPPGELSEFEGSDEFGDPEDAGGFDDDEDVWERL